MIWYIENPKQSTKKLLDSSDSLAQSTKKLLNEFCKVAGYKISVQSLLTMNSQKMKLS